MSPDKSNESNVVPDVSDTLFLKWCTRVGVLPHNTHIPHKKTHTVRYRPACSRCVVQVLARVSATLDVVAVWV